MEAEISARFLRVARERWTLRSRTAGWLGLCLLQLLLMSVAHKMPADTPAWINPFAFFRNFGLIGIAGFAAFILISWHRRAEIVRQWQSAQTAHSAGRALAANLALFALLFGATLGLRAAAAGGISVSYVEYAAYGILVAATVISLLRVDVPIKTMASIALAHPAYLAAAMAAGVAVRLGAFLAQGGWAPLSTATLHVSRSILSLYEHDLAIDTVEKSIRIGQFKAIIGDACSGFEGIALVSVFLAIYLWCFRTTLRFPRAYMLFAIGIAVIWFTNAIRIALLVSLGAHLSPEVAVHGFHSQAGWIFFLLVTIGLMAVAQGSAYFKVSSAVAAAGAPAGKRGSDDAMLAYLVPFMALMAASIVLLAIQPYDRPLYALKVIAVGLALWTFRNAYRGLSRNVSLEAIAVGLVVGVLWIATDPDPAGGKELGSWLDAQGPLLAGLWILLRVVGSVITVPIAEELAFRGLLHRWIVARAFDTVPFERFAPVAFLVSSALFGLMHDRWLAGALAGAVFALVMYRSRNIAGPIAAHMAANAIICAWALIFERWSLL